MTDTERIISEALIETPSEEAEARHLAQIQEAATADLRMLAVASATRIKALESFKAQAEFQIMNLTEQMAAVVESQKREDTEAHKALRRSILALALAEVIRSMGVGPDEFDSPYADWDHACIEVHRRYGGPELGLWLNPPDHVSDKTKALVRLFLQRRQEA